MTMTGCAKRMSVCLLSRLGPRHVLSFTLDFDPQSLTLQMPHKFPIYSMSLTKTKSQLRFWECFKFSRDSRWISSWSHSFIWLLLNIERFIQSCKSIICSNSKLPYVIQRNWNNLSFSMCLSEKGYRPFIVIKWTEFCWMYFWIIKSLWSSPII